MTNEALLPHRNFSIKIGVVENVMTRNENSKGPRLAFCGRVSSSRQCPDFIRLRFEGDQRRPLVAEALCVV